MIDEPQTVVDAETIDNLVNYQNLITKHMAELEGLRGERKQYIENVTQDLSPSDYRNFVATLAENMNVPQTAVLKILGEQITRGDIEVVNTDGEKIGVLYLADIFSANDSGVWEMHNGKMLWHMDTGEEPGSESNPNDDDQSRVNRV